MAFSLELDDDVRRHLERRVERSEFESLEEYVSFVLEQVVTPTPELGSNEPDNDRESAVRDQLESLGYLE